MVKPLIKFIFRLLTHLSVLLTILLPLQLIGIIVILPGILISRYISKTSNLPKLLKWFDNADIYPEIQRDPVTYLTQVLPRGVLYQYYWLAIRNPLNYFGYKVLGIYASVIAVFETTQTFFEKVTDINTAEVSDQQYPGFIHNEYVLNSVNYYEYYLVYRWKRFPTKCLRFRMGWKLGLPINMEQNQWIQWVLVLQPYKDFTGSITGSITGINTGLS